MYNCYLRISNPKEDLIKILNPHLVFTDVSTVVHFTVAKIDLDIFRGYSDWHLYYMAKGSYGVVKDNLSIEWSNFEVVSEKEKRFFSIYFNLGELNSSEG